MKPIPELPTPAPRVVAEQAEPDEFHAVFKAFGRNQELAAKLFLASFLDDPDVQAFVGRLDGRPGGYTHAINRERATGG